MLLDNPGWLALIPDSPQRGVMDPAEEAAVLTALKLDGRVYLACDNAARQHYLVELDNGRCLFVKRIAAQLHDRVRQAEDVSEWLFQQGCCIAPLFDIVEFRQDGRNYHLWVYHYVQGRLCKPAMCDISLLGSSLAEMHMQLKRNPNVLRWRDNTLARYRQLEAIRQQVLSGVIRHYHINEAVHRLFEKYHFDYFLRDGAVPLHGNLSPENFLVTLDKNICFFDFSETPYHFQPVITELAYTIERLILTRIEDDRVALTLGREFLRSYVDAGGDYCAEPADADCLHFLLLKAFCILLVHEQSKIHVDQREWEKLLYLLNIANQRGVLFARMLF